MHEIWTDTATDETDRYLWCRKCGAQTSDEDHGWEWEYGDEVRFFRRIDCDLSVKKLKSHSFEQTEVLDSSSERMIDGNHVLMDMISLKCSKCGFDALSNIFYEGEEHGIVTKIVAQFTKTGFATGCHSSCSAVQMKNALR